MTRSRKITALLGAGSIFLVGAFSLFVWRSIEKSACERAVRLCEIDMRDGWPNGNNPLAVEAAVMRSMDRISQDGWMPWYYHRERAKALEMDRQLQEIEVESAHRLSVMRERQDAMEEFYKKQEGEFNKYDRYPLLMEGTEEGRRLLSVFKEKQHRAFEAKLKEVYGADISSDDAKRAADEYRPDF